MLSRGERKTEADFRFKPDGKLWEVDRESALVVFGGQRALLMQVAHPLVGHAVAEHSDFPERPVGRLIQTLNPTYNVIFGENERSSKGARSINTAHRRVHGALTEDIGIFPAGTPYDARDPELINWVWATLVDSALPVYERFVRPLSGEYREEYYQEAKGILAPLGGKPKDAPQTYEDFTAFMDEMHSNGTLVVGKDARELAPHILLQASPLTRAAARPSARIAVNMLREPLREQYADVLKEDHGFQFSQKDQRFDDRIVNASKTILPHLPGVVRYMPHYHRAQRQLR